jgi:tetratricopeptide (TPR) repeat protein
VAFVAAAAAFLIHRGVPAAAEQIAQRIPVEAEVMLGRESLKGMDDFLMKPSTLSQARQNRLRQKLAATMRAAGDTTPYRLEFRASPVIGANAFALPSGIIVMTDELVGLAKRDEEILAVLAHEVGHVRHRHTMRMLLEASATALVIAGITGDIGSAAALASSAPTILLQAKYSRDSEREADAYAVEMMRKAALSPHYLGVILARLEQDHKGPGLPTFLSTHPATQERAALAGRGESDDEVAQEDEKEPEKPQIKIVNPAQLSIIALVEQRDFEALDLRLGGLHERFEQDLASSLELEIAFRAFRNLPPGGEAALNEWIEKRPESYSARTARGVFYLWRGIAARGTAYRSDTPREKMDRMHADLRQARADLERSFGMTPKPYVSRLSMVTLTRYIGSREEGKRHYTEAAKIAPQSVELRLARLTSLEPRWGGSYAEMEAFATQTARELSDPRARARVAVRVPVSKAHDRTNAKDYPEALRLYGEAIAQAPDAYTLCSRSWVLGQLKRHDEAYADVKQALSMERDETYCHERATYEVAHVKDREEVIRMMTEVIEVNPGLAGAYNHRAWAYMGQAKHDLAVPDLLASAKLGDPWAQSHLGMAYLEGHGVTQNPAEAVPWLEKAAAQGDPEAPKLLDRALKVR